jgi:quercetin dioxygenase-like cupin family protein
MDTADFEAKLKQDGYHEIATRSMEHRPANGDHVHEFSVRGLVTSGEFIVTCGGDARSYGPGDVFEVAAGEMHNEAIGPEGATIVAGRLY